MVRNLDRVPKTTVDLRPVDNLPVIEFAEKFEVPIRTGTKTSTVRMWDEPKVNRGQQFRAITTNNAHIGNYVCSSLDTRTAEDIILNGVEGHRQYDSFEEFRDEMLQYYPGVDIDDHTEFTVMHWR